MLYNCLVILELLTGVPHIPKSGSWLIAIVQYSVVVISSTALELRTCALSIILMITVVLLPPFNRLAYVRRNAPSLYLYISARGLKACGMHRDFDRTSEFLR